MATMYSATRPLMRCLLESLSLSLSLCLSLNAAIAFWYKVDNSNSLNAAIAFWYKFENSESDFSVWLCFSGLSWNVLLCRAWSAASKRRDFLRNTVISSDTGHSFPCSKVPTLHRISNGNWHFPSAVYCAAGLNCNTSPAVRQSSSSTNHVRVE